MRQRDGKGSVLFQFFLDAVYVRRDPFFIFIYFHQIGIERFEPSRRRRRRRHRTQTKTPTQERSKRAKYRKQNTNKLTNNKNSIGKVYQTLEFHNTTFALNLDS